MSNCESGRLFCKLLARCFTPSDSDTNRCRRDIDSHPYACVKRSKKLDSLPSSTKQIVSVLSYSIVVLPGHLTVSGLKLWAATPQSSAAARGLPKVRNPLGLNRRSSRDTSARFQLWGAVGSSTDPRTVIVTNPAICSGHGGCLDTVPGLLKWWRPPGSCRRCGVSRFGEGQDSLSAKVRVYITRSLDYSPARSVWL